MKKRIFVTLLKSRVVEKALIYLKKKIKSKLSEIVYSKIELADYLQLINPMSIKQKQKLFAIKENGWFKFLITFPNRTKYFVVKLKDIFTSNILNNGINQIDQYENIFNFKISQQTKIFHKLEEIWKRKKN
jgi:hypothetical protein